MSGEHEDDRLVEELRRVAALVDPVPPRVLDAARGSFTWRTIDAELAELAFDSARPGGERGARPQLGRPPPADVRLPGALDRGRGDRDGAGAPLVGQLVPPQPAEIEVRHAGGFVSVAADELGRFAADGVAGGPVSLVCRLGDATGTRTVVTAWLVI